MGLSAQASDIKVQREDERRPPPPSPRRNASLKSYHRGIQIVDSVGFAAMDTRGWHGNRFHVMTPGMTS